MTRRMKLSLGVMCTLPMLACAGLISIPDAVLDPNAHPGDVDGSVAIDGSSGVDASGSDASLPDGAPGTDATTCTANTQSDPANCGACGNDCSKGTCAKGVCTLFVSKNYAVASLYASGTRLFLARSGVGEIAECTTSGCGDLTVTSITKDLDTSDMEPLAITGDSNYLYWTNYFDGTNAPAGLYRTPYDGGKSQSLGAHSKLGYFANGIAVDGTNVYAASDTEGPFYSPLAGPTPPFVRLRTDAGAQTTEMVTGGGSLFWAEGPQIWRAANSNLSAASLFFEEQGALHLAITSSHLYFISEFEEKLSRCPITGCTSSGRELLLSTAGEQTVTGIAATSNAVYITFGSSYAAGNYNIDAKVKKCVPGGATYACTDIATSIGYAHSPFIFGSNLYWISDGGAPTDLGATATVMKAPL